MPDLIQIVIEWAHEQAVRIAREGRALSAGETAVAVRVGVNHPELVRILEIAEVPLPDHPHVRLVATAAGLDSAWLGGLTLGYGIYLRPEVLCDRVISHELRHVHQCEQCGSLDNFLRKWIEQVMANGYADAPFERDARAHEGEWGGEG